MKRDLLNEIEIPECVEVLINENMVTVKGPEGENNKKFNAYKINIEKKDSKIIVERKNAGKKEKNMINTITAHIKNMIEGVQKKFEYTLKVCSSHFPMTVEKKDNKISVKNFFGEKIPRTVNLKEGIETEVKKDIITVKSTDKERAGQAATDIEMLTKIISKDRRIFQDGIYITNKAGKDI